MLNKIYIVDFEDSFTFNIANIIYPQIEDVVVVDHHIFFQDHWEKIIKNKEKIAVILGPGPGHPNEYQRYFEKIAQMMKASHVYTMGICLGHQVIGRVLGFEVQAAQELIHGMSVDFNYNGKNIKVQRYNSLAVYCENQELNLINLPQGITYQFHPESMGSSENLLFFNDLIKFIKT